MRAPRATAPVVALAAAGAFAASAGVARADIPEPPPKHWIGASAVLVPSGTLTRSVLLGSQEDSMAVAYGAGLVAERTILPNLSWMLAPRILTNIRGADDGEGADSSTQLDLRLGMRAHARLRPQIDVFGYGAGGYSIVFLPDDPGDDVYPQGLLVAAGLGLDYRWTGSTTVSLSLGYQLAFQEVEYEGGAVIYKDRLLDVTVGFLAALD
ncbi:MAG TPA: hypothetical protein VM261_24340 [Kofleriaceae bacterium]|nr:hypothetical protein [Kofleriaceae bacterium]